MLHPDTIHLKDGLLPEEVRERMQQRTLPRSGQPNWSGPMPSETEVVTTDAKPVRRKASDNLRAALHSMVDAMPLPMVATMLKHGAELLDDMADEINGIDDCGG